MRSGFAIFLTIVLSIWALMHLYVFWRLSSVPWISSRVTGRNLALVAFGLWSFYPLTRFLESLHLPPVLLVPLEFLAANWIGVLFLFVSALLTLDVVTLGGWLARTHAPALRGYAVIVVALLSVVALVQGLRPPTVRDYEVTLPGLPPERDGLLMVHISDLHLGTLIGQRWFGRLAARVTEMQPDLVVVAGDLIDGNAERVEPMLPSLKRLSAPLGVWAVTGNHEYYAGADRSVALMEAAGYRVLRNRPSEIVPGLVIAGVDDLTARLQFGNGNDPLKEALANAPAGATILISHSPLQVEKAAALGADLMLSGHTHNGQIWPFTYLVATRYPFTCGSFAVDGMRLIVSRGTGTWGPRMRLWKPGEILRIRLRSKNSDLTEASAVNAAGRAGQRDFRQLPEKVTEQ